MKHSMLPCINSLLKLYVHSAYASTRHHLVRGIPHRGGELREVAFAFVVVTLLFCGNAAKADQKFTTARDHAQKLIERARGSAESNNQRNPHGKPVSVSAVRDPGEDGHWAHVGISSLGGHVAIYDPKRDRMIVYGGDDDGTLRYDTWSLSMTDPHPWSKLTPSGPTPPQPQLQTAVYDPVRDRMLILGNGWTDPGASNDVWALSLSGAPQWSQLAIAGSKPDLGGPVIYDAVQDRLVLSDGSSSIWVLSLSGTPQWTQITAAGTPPGIRYFPATVYDSARDRMLFWGGDNDDYPMHTELWELSLGATPTWTQIPTQGAPPEGRFAVAVIYDPVSDRVAFWGGSNYHNMWDGWTLSLAGTPTWTQLDMPPALDSRVPYPAGRSFNTAVYDSARQRMVIFSGYQFNHGSPDRNDVWALSLNGAPVWSPVRGTSPEPRFGHQAVYDPDADRMLVFGGRPEYSWFENISELWELTLDERPTWNQLRPSGNGPSTGGGAIVYDDQRHRLIVFAENGLFSLATRGKLAWTQLNTQGVAPPSIKSAAYDSRRHRVVALTTDNTPWELSLSNAPRWQPINAVADRPVIGGSVAVYDKKHDRLLIWGGALFGEGDNRDVWALSLSGTPRWTPIVAAGPYPAGRDNYSLVYDEKRDRLILHAGHHHTLGEPWTWELSLSGTPTWRPLESTFDGWIILDDGHSAIYDPVRDRMIVFGGRYFYNSFNETWSLQFGTPAASTTTVAGVTIGLQPAYPNPFNPRVTIPFTLANDGRVTLAIYDVSGRLVKTLVNEWTTRGEHSVTWEGIDERGEHIASGVYFYQLTAGSRTETRKIVLVK